MQLSVNPHINLAHALLVLYVTAGGGVAGAYLDDKPYAGIERALIYIGAIVVWPAVLIANR